MPWLSSSNWLEWGLLGPYSQNLSTKHDKIRGVMQLSMQKSLSNSLLCFRRCNNFSISKRKQVIPTPRPSPPPTYFSSKTKLLYLRIFRTSHFKKSCCIPLVDRFCCHSAKMYQNKQTVTKAL